MRRLAFALALALLVPAPVSAQYPVAHKPAVGAPQVSYGSHIPIFKSGGQILGRDGIYPYDSGEYLLGGVDGLARYHGGFTMELPGAEGAVLMPGKHRFHTRAGLFRR